MKKELKELFLLAVVAISAILVHGYHPAIEDAEIYLPAIKKALNPALYPHNDVFFMSHARMTAFPQLIAASVRISHLPLSWALLLWHWFSIFLVLLGCSQLGKLAFRNAVAQWGGVALVASLLTLPVAGTALYIMDEYLNPRSLSTAAVLFIIVNIVQRRFVRALLWTVATAFIHPLMVVFGAVYAATYLYFARTHAAPMPRNQKIATIAAILPIGLFSPVTQAYRDALNTRPYFFLLRWHWYEWLGIFGPLILFAWWRSIARRRQESTFQHLCEASIAFGLMFFLAAMIITFSATLVNFVELQPMRSLHLLYVVMLVLGGGLLAEFVLKRLLWRWAIVFVPLCAVMAVVQLQTFPNTAHLELPWTHSHNEWVRTYEWIRNNTPADSYFALDPDAMSLPREDQHGFRAIAERSMLADNVKDTGAVTMFPSIAETWQQQVRAQAGWRNFRAADFLRLKKNFGVDWTVVESPVPEFHCPFRTTTLTVCRVD